MDSVDAVVGFAGAALAGGAGGLRIEGAERVRAVKAAYSAPVIGLIKRDLPDSPVRITPFLQDVDALADAGAQIIAVDCTDRSRPVPVRELIAYIRARGCIAMADCACLADAQAALSSGAQVVGSTMSGYTGGPVPHAPDIALVRALRGLGAFVIAEGRLNTPELAAQAARAGADAVVVGSAITRPDHITAGFVHAVDRHIGKYTAPPVLAIDIGGTKTMLALVCQGRVLEVQTSVTARHASPTDWLDQVFALAAPWQGRYSAVGAAVTGLVDHGLWSPLNTKTLRFASNFTLQQAIADRFGVPATVLNDAQAAAWGEYRFGAGQGFDMVFLTVSTGVGGGVVVGGQLHQGRNGLAGHFGVVQIELQGQRVLVEDTLSGRWMAAQAAQQGHGRVDAREVFVMANTGRRWADQLVRTSAKRLADVCANIQLQLAPHCIVLGGGIGLATGYLAHVQNSLAQLPAPLQPQLVAAALGAHAGVIGAADMAAISNYGPTTL